MSAIQHLLSPHVSDVGFPVQRLLPTAEVQSVGPFVFFDHMGPALFTREGTGGDVRPHPHIGLSTVTYLYSGAMMHRDSLGYAQRIEPGDINLMIAGSGIVHSERIHFRSRRYELQRRAFNFGWLYQHNRKKESLHFIIIPLTYCPHSVSTGYPCKFLSANFSDWSRQLLLTRQPFRLI